MNHFCLFRVFCFFVVVVYFVNAESNLNNFKNKSVKDKKNSPNFCQNSKLSPIEGRQKENGSCSSTQQGEIPNSKNMVSSLIIFPKNNAVVAANKSFKIVIAVKNLETGHFSNPKEEYYSFSQQLNNKGQIKGHQHITIQRIEKESPPDALNPVFFKGIDEEAKNNLLKTSVDKGLKEGSYRICTISSSFSHQPVIMPIARRGSQDDCIRIKVE